MSGHSSHCCKKHGCKYGSDVCPVVLGIEKQEYAQECCELEAKSLKMAYALVLKDMKERNLEILIRYDIEKLLQVIKPSIQ